MKDRERIEYKSENGYSGSLYGRASMRIYDKNGNEVLHTGFRNVNTLEELKEVVDNMPEFLEKNQKSIQRRRIRWTKQNLNYLR